jgi:hypothetical protein
MRVKLRIRGIAGGAFYGDNGVPGKPVYKCWNNCVWMPVPALLLFPVGPPMALERSQ